MKARVTFRTLALTVGFEQLCRACSTPLTATALGVPIAIEPLEPMPAGSAFNLPTILLWRCPTCASAANAKPLPPERATALWRAADAAQPPSATFTLPDMFASAIYGPVTLETAVPCFDCDRRRHAGYLGVVPELIVATDLASGTRVPLDLPFFTFECDHCIRG